MPLYKNDSPILEYDDEQRAVIMPDHEKLASLPERAVFAFLGDEVERFALKHHLPVISRFQTITKTYPVWKMEYKGKELALCQAPLGSAAAVQFMDWLIGYGVKNIIAAGSCGALLPLEENEFLIPVEALRDEGASYHYLPPSRTVIANETAVQAIEQALLLHKLPCKKCKTWTTDGFYRETKAMVEYRKEEGSSVVEMECAGLMACAQFRGAVFGQLLYTADSLANVEQHDMRGFGEASMPVALQLCLDAVTLL